jgi:hypothetical protein
MSIGQSAAVVAAVVAHGDDVGGGNTGAESFG